jgi:hypothetical protein
MLSMSSIAFGQASAKSDSSGENVVGDPTVTLFSEGFEGAFPGTYWYVNDLNPTNGYDYWDDTNYKAYAGYWSGWCAQVGMHTKTVTIFTEGFEGAFPGTAWTVGDSTSGGGYDYWDDTNYKAYSGSWSGWCAQVGYQTAYPYYANSAVHKYDNNMDAYMYRYVDLTGYTSATLTYRYWLDCEGTYDYFAAMWYDSIEGWITTNARSGHYASSGWQYASVNIPTTTHYVGFKFHSDNSVIYEGAYVDDVSLFATGNFYNNADHLYDNYMDSVMYRTVSLGSYYSVTLSYYYWLDCETTYDYLQAMYRIGSTWYYLNTKTGGYGYWQYASVSIPNTANAVGFRFHSDSSVIDYGAYLDNIVCTANYGVYFSDGFESGSFSAWSGSAYTYGETRTVTTELKFAGLYSARFTSNGGGGTESAYCYKNILVQNNLYARGYFRVSTNGIVDVGDRFYFIRFNGVNSTDLAYAGWYKTSAGIRWVLNVRNGTGWIWRYSSTIPSMYTWYRVELHWRLGTMSTGIAELFVNGVRVCYVSSTNTASLGPVYSVRTGLPTIVNCASTRVYADNVALSTGYIGP